MLALLWIAAALAAAPARAHEDGDATLARIDAAIAARAGTSGDVAALGFEPVFARRASFIGRLAERLLVRLLPA